MTNKLDLNVQFHNGKWWTVTWTDDTRYDKHTKQHTSKKKAIEYGERLQNDEVVDNLCVYSKDGKFESQSSVLFIRPSNKERLSK